MADYFDLQNPWRGHPGFNVAPYIPRFVFDQIRPWLHEKDVIVLHGPRQAGKTTLLWKIVETLLSDGVPAASIFYFNFDLREFQDLAGSPAALLQFVSSRAPDGKAWIFLDEAQRLQSPGLTIKALADLPNQPFKLFVSGSSSLELKAKTKEHLTGRQLPFEILPLSFEERLQSRRVPSPVALPEREWTDYEKAFGPALQAELAQALLFGGYPGVYQVPTNEKKQQRLWALYQTYVERDIENFMRVENVPAFNTLVKLLVFQHAHLVNKAELSKSIGIDQRTVDQYLRLLQETFVLDLISPYHSNRRREMVHMPKVFFCDVGLANAVAQRFEPWERRADRGALMENFVETELRKGAPAGARWHFWRTRKGAEVDFVMARGDRRLPIEVKSGALKAPEFSRSLRSFLDTYAPERAIVLNPSLRAEATIANTRVHFVPLHLFFCATRHWLAAVQ